MIAFRWFVRRGDARWLYYAKFDEPPADRKVFIVFDKDGKPSIDHVEETPVRLLEFAENIGAYRKAGPE